MRFNNSVKYGLILGVIFLMVGLPFITGDYTINKWSILVDMALTLIFCFLVYLRLKSMREDSNQRYSFVRGFLAAFRIGRVGVLTYFFLNLGLGGLLKLTSEGFIIGVMTQMPYTMAESVIKLVLVFVSSFFVPIYFALKKSDVKSDVLDDDFLEEDEKI